MKLLKQIIIGHINELKSLTGKTSEEQEKIFKKRADICNSCPLKSGNNCNRNKYINPETFDVVTTPKKGYVKGCGCRLSAKQKSLTSECPAKFWKKVI